MTTKKKTPASEKVFSLQVKWFSLSLSYKIAIVIMAILFAAVMFCRISVTYEDFSCRKTSVIEQLKR